MSNLAKKLCDSNSLLVYGCSYTALSHDNQQMKLGAEYPCLRADEDETGDEVNFFYHELEKADEANELIVYTLQLWDNIQPRKEDLERVCEENFPGSEIISFMEALERWSVLNKDDLKRLDDCLKLRVLGHREDARDIITLATKAEFKNAKKADVGVQLMHAMQGGWPVVFYEWTNHDGRVCKGGRYGTDGHEYASFYL